MKNEPIGKRLPIMALLRTGRRWKETDANSVSMSRLPIYPKLKRAIMNGESFNNLKSNVTTRVRWSKDKKYYIVSMRPACEEIDIAAGRREELPFMFLAPYWIDPKNHPYYSDGRLDIAYRYSIARQVFARLNQLEIDIKQARYAVGSFVNEKTGRKNKIYSSVPWLTTHPVGLRRRYINEERCYDDFRDSDGHIDYNRYNKYKKCVPLFEYGWYFRDGTKVPLAVTDDDTNIEQFIDKLDQQK